MVKNYVLCMACFCNEVSRGDDRRAKFSLVYEIRASKLNGDDVTAFSLSRQRAMLYLAVSSPKVFRGA